MNRNKALANSLVFFLGTFLFFILAYIGFTEQNIDLNTCDKIESVITNTGVGIDYGSKGAPTVFFIQLAGIKNRLDVYRMGGDYSNLTNKCSIGDSLTAYFSHNDNRPENENIELIQDEKKRVIIKSKKEYERKESSLIYIGIIGTITCLIFSHFYSKKLERPNTKKNQF